MAQLQLDWALIPLANVVDSIWATRYQYKIMQFTIPVLVVVNSHCSTLHCNIIFLGYVCHIVLLYASQKLSQKKSNVVI